jgi:hypothetical protein
LKEEEEEEEDVENNLRRKKKEILIRLGANLSFHPTKSFSTASKIFFNII